MNAIFERNSSLVCASYRHDVFGELKVCYEHWGPKRNLEIMFLSLENTTSVRQGVSQDFMYIIAYGLPQSSQIPYECHWKELKTP